jgi:transposase
MTLEAELSQLRAENQALTEQLGQAVAQIQTLQAELVAAQQRTTELEQQHRPPPPFVTAKTPKRERMPRRKRAPEHNRARREPPTRIVQHALARCPDCHYRLRGQSIARRQVIEVPAPPPVEVTEHQVLKRWCPKCEQWCTPRLDLQDQVVGQGRLGVQLASLLAYLRTTLRLPMRLIRSSRRTLHGIPISMGEIVELLHRLRRATEAAVAELKAEARASPILHGDETGWREDGQHGYIWSFSTPGPDSVRYYEYDHSRSRLVVKRILGGTFQGVLSSDFYDELFQFLLVDGLSADNHLAERSLRPLVVMRKISGGTRSPQGSQTRLALASLFGTWQVRGQNPFEECLKLLAQTPLPQI